MDSYKIYMNLDHHLMDECELMHYIEEWGNTLVMQGFSAEKITQIIFDGPHFKSYFINEEMYLHIKRIFEKKLGIS